MHGPLARRAALFLFYLLLYFMQNTHGMVRFRVCCASFVSEFGRKQRKLPTDKKTSQPKPVELELAADKKTSQPKDIKPKELKHAIDKKTSQPEALKPVQLDLAIDKKNNQVLYAHLNKDFVDVLLSFLKFPMGTIIRLADKKSGIGCMDELCWSVEDFDEECFQAKASKTMLLNPRSACG